MRQKLNRKAIEALQAQGRPYDVADIVVPGFAVRIHPGGAKVFVLRYRPKGGGRAVNPRTMKLGAHPTMTPEQARELAIIRLSEVAGGRDPARERPTIPQVRTVGAALDRYLEHLAGKPALRTSGSVIKLYLRPALGRLDVAQLTAAHLARVTDPLRQRRKLRTAGQCLAVLRAALRRAKEMGEIAEAPAIFPKVHQGRKRTKAATGEQVLAIVEAINALWHENAISPWAAVFLLLLIYTGARPKELRLARPEQIDRRREALVLVEHKTAEKTGEERVIQLSGAAIALLDSLPRVRGNPHLFCGRRRGQPLMNYAKPWKAVCERAGVTGIAPYDMRHAYVSLGLSAGYSLDLLKKAAGHSAALTTARYAHVDDATRMEIAEAIAGRLPPPRPRDS